MESSGPLHSSEGTSEGLQTRPAAQNTTCVQVGGVFLLPITRMRSEPLCADLFFSSQKF